MATILPRHVLCVLGNWSTLEPLQALVDESASGFTIDTEYSTTAPDPRMQKAFEESMDRVNPSFDEDDEAAVEAHRAVAYILSPPIPQPRAREISSRALALVAK